MLRILNEKTFNFTVFRMFFVFEKERGTVRISVFSESLFGVKNGKRFEFEVFGFALVFEIRFL